MLSNCIEVGEQRLQACVFNIHTIRLSLPVQPTDWQVIKSVKLGIKFSNLD